MRGLPGSPTMAEARFPSGPMNRNRMLAQSVVSTCWAWASGAASSRSAASDGGRSIGDGLGWRYGRSRMRPAAFLREELLLAPARADPHRTLQLVRVLQHLLPQIGRQVWMVAEIRAHHVQRLAARLTSQERAQPGAEEEDPAMVLDVGQGIEGRPQVGQRERLMLDRIEGAEAGAGPVLVERRVGEPAPEIVRLDLRGGTGRVRDEGAPAPVRGRVARRLRDGRLS